MDATAAKAKPNKASKTKQNQRMSEAQHKIYELDETQRYPVVDLYEENFLEWKS